MKNYSKIVKEQGQLAPALGHDMVENSAGGYSFKVTDQVLLERFLLIGTEGGTYYAKEQKLTKDNAETIIKYIKSNGQKVLKTVVDFSSRAPKADATIFVLALLTTYGSEEVKKPSYDAIVKVCRTSTQLFMFLANIKQLRGWSRGLRKGVAKFYTTKTEQQVAYQMVKYRERAGYTHRDALRLSHTKALSTSMSQLFGYAVGKVEGHIVAHDLVKAFAEAQHAPKENLVQLIKEFGLTWEMIPNEMLNDKAVLRALLPGMPLIALVRNLNRFSYNGLTEGEHDISYEIVNKLTDKDTIFKSGIHPINVVNAMVTYNKGQGVKGNKTWAPNQNIVDALASMYETALNNTGGTGKRILIGADVSGSMNTEIGGMALKASQIAQVLALTILKTEKNAELICFDDQLQNPVIGRRSSVQEAIEKAPSGGGTDCALPIGYALLSKKFFDSIIILTDSETWAGKTHAVEFLDAYRNKINPNVKIIEIALESEGYSNFPKDDPNVLRIVGFDASVTELIDTFLE